MMTLMLIEVVAVENERDIQTHGLELYQLKPEGKVGEELFDHMIAFRRRTFAKRPEDHKISDHHGIVSPMKG